MSLLHMPKPPAPPKDARTISKATPTDVPLAPPAEATEPQTQRRAQHPSDALCARIECELHRGPATPEAVAAVTGDHVVNVYKALRQMRREQRVHVAKMHKPYLFALGPSPVADREVMTRRAPGAITCSILKALLREGPLTSRALRKALGQPMHSAAPGNAAKAGYLTRSGLQGSSVYALTDTGRKLAEYLVMLEEAYPCS